MQQDYRSILRKSSILPIRCEDIDLDHCSNPSLEHVVPFHDVSLVCSSLQEFPLYMTVYFRHRQAKMRHS
jgi:hypothetical protein